MGAEPKGGRHFARRTARQARVSCFSRLRARTRGGLLFRIIPPVPSLRQLLARHSTFLVLDASSSLIEASLWRGPYAGSAIGVESIEGEASTALPRAVASLLDASGLRIHDLDAIAFCDGPGSILGIRLAAASLRTWRAVRPGLALYAFHGLPLLAVAHPELTVVADARRDRWHVVRPGEPHDLLRLSSDELVETLAAHGTSRALATPASFRRWSAPPAGTELRPLPFSATALLAAAPDEPFFHETDQPEAFLGEAPSYVAWVPRIHQAPTPA